MHLPKKLRAEHVCPYPIFMPRRPGLNNSGEAPYDAGSKTTTGMLTLHIRDAWEDHGIQTWHVEAHMGGGRSCVWMEAFLYNICHTTWKTVTMREAKWKRDAE
jgi:hypothetical protein